MKKNAFTLAELTVCIVMMMILAIFAVTNIKPNENKIRLFVYGAMDNISAVVSTLVSEESSGLTSGNFVTSSGTYDWLCTKVGDYFTLKSEANCNTSASSTDVNFTFTNNVTVQGFAAPWTEDSRKAPDGTKYKYKEFVIDIDGAKGMNEDGIDRFSMRIYSGGLLEGALIPINQMTAKEIINYDIFVPESANASKATMVASYQSYKDADCGIFGGTGYFKDDECKSGGKKIYLKCLTTDLCSKCGQGICPKTEDGTQLTVDSCKARVKTKNPNEIACFMMLHKPSTGAGLIIDTVADTMME